MFGHVVNVLRTSRLITITINHGNKEMVSLRVMIMTVVAISSLIMKKFSNTQTSCIGGIFFLNQYK